MLRPEHLALDLEALAEQRLDLVQPAQGMQHRAQVAQRCPAGIIVACAPKLLAPYVLEKPVLGHAAQQGRRIRKHLPELKCNTLH